MNDYIVKTLQNDIKFALEVPKSIQLRERYFSSPSDFTRNRKLPFNLTLAMMIKNDKRDLSRTIEDFFLDDLSDMYNMKAEQLPSNSAFCQQRVKIKPEFFHDWMKFIANDFFEQVEGYNLWHGMILAAFDGSRIKVPDVPELRKKYGYNRGHGDSEKPLSMMCVLSDLLNGLIIDAEKGTARTSEQRLAYTMLETLPKLPRKILFVCDRAYTSYKMMKMILDSGNSFIIRASKSRTNTIKEFVASNKKEDLIKIYASNNIRSELHKKGITLPKDASITVRAVKYNLPSGEIEVLLTNLTREELSRDEIVEAYPLRWGIETTIGYVKNEEQIEVSPGLNDHCFTQGFYIALIQFSLSSIIMLEDKEKLQKINSEPKLKYKVKINRNNTWSDMQRLFPKTLIKPECLRTQIHEMAILWLRNTCPIRPGRHYKRKPRGTGKYITFTNYKRAI